MSNAASCINTYTHTQTHTYTHTCARTHTHTHPLAVSIIATKRIPDNKDLLAGCHIFKIQSTQLHPAALHALSADTAARGDYYTHSRWVSVSVCAPHRVLISLGMHAHDIFWTYVQPVGSQQSPCVERCTQAPVRCACWLRSGPGPLAAQDRPPQSPPPHRTALLCSSSSGPGAASGGRGARHGSRGKDRGRDRDSDCGSMARNKEPTWRWDGGALDTSVSHVEACSQAQSLWRRVPQSTP